MSTDLHVSIPLTKHGLPLRHWAGRTKATQHLRNWVNQFTAGHLSDHEATDLMEDLLQIYLHEQPR